MYKDIHGFILAEKKAGGLCLPLFFGQYELLKFVSERVYLGEIFVAPTLYSVYSVSFFIHCEIVFTGKDKPFHQLSVPCVHVYGSGFRCVFIFGVYVL